MKINWNFLAGGGGGGKTKTFHGGSMDFFLELHIGLCSKKTVKVSTWVERTWVLRSKN